MEFQLQYLDLILALSKIQGLCFGHCTLDHLKIVHTILKMGLQFTIQLYGDRTCYLTLSESKDLSIKKYRNYIFKKSSFV